MRFSLVAARNLQNGDTVQDTDGGTVIIESISVDHGKMVSGGDIYKSAMALKLTTSSGQVFFVHPGSEIYAVRNAKDQMMTPTLLCARR